MRYLFLAVTIVCFVFACKKSAGEDTLAACFDNGSGSDSSLIAGRMKGTWKLTAQACPLGTDYPDVKVSFSADRKYVLIEDGDVVQQGTWSFRSWGSGWSLETSQSSNYFFGATIICDGKLIFAGQALDGCNHYFRKIH
jgi:hypothetical protein